ncbi:MAG TPA: DUF308 domain-containing protein [Candidatus Limnocylindrales bacterium]|nr:DUF308 domain-containing protein [Candidatus Limnocylindrales bacterium]
MDEAGKVFRRGNFSGGVISIAMGVLLLAWPDKTLLVVAALIGLLLVLLGVVRFVEAVSARSLPGSVRVPRGLVGLVLMILGTAVLRHPAGSLAVLTMLLGIAWMIGGLAQIAFAFTGGGRGGSRTATLCPAPLPFGPAPLLLGVLDVIAGLVLFLWPQTSLTVVVWVVGIWLIVIGVIQLVLGLMTPRPKLG